MALQHLRSNTANKRPDPTAMADGQLAINTPAVSPGLFFKDAAGVLVKVGPVHVGTTAPNASPASGGTAGNSVGEQWLDTTGGTYVFKVWDGSAWRSESGTFVDVNGDTMTGALGIIAGSAAVPGLYFSGDTNTGIYSPGADQLAISTSSVGRVFVDANGNVGVGATPSAWASPFVAMQIGPGGAALAGRTDSQQVSLATNWRFAGSQNLYISNGFAGRYFQESGVHVWQTASSGTAGNAITFNEAMRLDTSGRLGVGTSSPTEALTVNGRVQSQWNAFVNGGSTSYSGDATSLVTGSTAGMWAARSDSALLFSISSSEKVRIDSSGRLGIGTSSPSAKFVVSNNGANGLEFFPELYADTNTIASFNRSTSSYKSLRFECSDYAFLTGATTAVSINSSGRVGIGTTSATEKLHVDGNILAGAGGQIMTVSGSAQYGTRTANSVLFLQNNGEAARIDADKRLLVGTSSARGNFSAVDTPQFQVEGTTFNTSTISVTSASASGGGNIELAGTGTGTVGNTGTVSNNGYLGSIHFLGGDGTNLRKGAAIDCQVDGTPGANDMPGRLVFSTTADGASSPTERMVIKQNGYIGIGVSNPTIQYSDDTGVQLYSAGTYKGAGFFQTSGQPSLFVSRKASDGILVMFAQDGIEEGNISVSGTTVSYNGAHLSRWSQLPSGAERTEILRGSVLSNIDEMCEWGNEDNEQLNRMKVSDAEGDKNVSGVFQAWDDDDDTYTNDFYCAMTGDFIIRIAEGVTVERGDLLMSAGDGTAKPQDDDIIRSKTIAKVTSTNVSCTYDDGSYCVPCVLMAC